MARWNKHFAQTFQFTPLREGRRKLRRLMIRMTYFNSRPSARGDNDHVCKTISVDDFNSRPSARGDRKGEHGIVVCRISIHAPPRGATPSSLKRALSTQFQFTPLREGRQKKDHRRCHHHKFQFTPLREGRRYRAWMGEEALEISIHAPPRGATKPVMAYGLHQKISIHAPPRGATAYRPACFCRRYFNSRPSARGDKTQEVNAIAANGFQFTPLREGRRRGFCG